MSLTQSGLLAAVANLTFPKETSGLKLTEAAASLSAALNAPRELNRFRISSILNDSTVTQKVNKSGYNIHVPRDNGETLKEWKSRTSGLAKTLETASKGEITVDATSKGGRIIASVQTPSNDGGLFSKPAHEPITQGLFSNVA